MKLTDLFRNTPIGEHFFVPSDAYSKNGIAQTASYIRKTEGRKFTVRIKEVSNGWRVYVDAPRELKPTGKKHQKKNSAGWLKNWI